jgi:isoleucyl-tRNA synthetase
MWSTYYFASLYMNLDRFSGEGHPLESLRGTLRAEDRWVLSRFEKLVEGTTASMDGLKIFEAVRSMEDFMKEELSRWYIRLIRKRTWSEEEDPDKIAAYATLYHVLLNYLKMAAPVIPFASEKIYQDMFRGPGMAESIHMLCWPKPEGVWKDESLEVDMEIAKEVIEASYSARQSARVKIRQPLTRLRVVSDEKRVREAMKRLRSIVLEQTNVKEVEVISQREEEEMKGVMLSPNRSALGPVFRARSGRVAELIAGLDGKATLEALKRGEAVLLDLGDEKIELKKDYITVQEKLPENYRGVKSRFGSVYIDTTKSKELIAEGLMRDIVRRVQEMRKRANLRVDAYIKVAIFTPSDENRELLQGKAAEISVEVRAKEFTVTAKEAMKAKLVEEWEIDEDKFTIGIDELQPS